MNKTSELHITDLLSPRERLLNTLETLQYRVARAFDRVAQLAGPDIPLPNRIAIEVGDERAPWYVSYERVLGRVQAVVTYLNNDGRWEQGLLADHLDAGPALCGALPELLRAARAARKYIETDYSTDHLDDLATRAVEDAMKVPAEQVEWMAKVELSRRWRPDRTAMHGLSSPSIRDQFLPIADSAPHGGSWS